MSMIRYDYGSNYAQLDEIRAKINDIQAMREEVGKVFAALYGVYEGQARDKLQAMQIDHDQRMEAKIAEYTQTTNNGVQRQEDMAALDRSLAGGF